MFAKKNSSVAAPPRSGKAAAGLSFLGPEVVVTGHVTTAAQLHVEGRIDGDVDCTHLILGDRGAITGDITAEEARLCGAVAGRIDVRSLVIEASARLEGDVSYESISIASGARVDGRLTRRDPPVGAVSVPTPIALADADPSPSPSGSELFPVAQKQRAAGG